MFSIKKIFGLKDKVINKSIIQNNPYKNNADLKKRSFIKTAVLGGIGVGGVVLFSKLAKAIGIVFTDASYQSVAAGGGGANTSFFRAECSTAQAITNNTWTKISLNVETFDPLGEFDNVTNYRYTPLKAGYYLVTGTVRVGDTNYNQFIAIYKNRTKSLIMSRDPGGNSHSSTMVTDIIYLDGVDDYIELFFKHTKGSNATLETGVGERSCLAAAWIGE